MSSTVRVVVSFVVVVAACEGGGGWSQSRESAEGGVPTPTPVIDAPKEGEIGSLCARNGDCTSAQCLAIGRCTHACAAASECPVSWACDGVAGAGLLCTCAPTGGGEACNGRDDDCDGFADNGATCGDGLVCVAGSCQCPPERACDGAGSGCTDLANDPDHCGACGNRCGAGGFCAGGACSCSGGLTSCATGGCVDLTSDPFNCGSCGRSCGIGAECIDGACHSGPGGPCTTDAECGGLGTCRTEAQGAPGGECEVTCAQGFIDCPPGATCLVAICLRTCASDADCRPGYMCDWLGTCAVDCRTDPTRLCDASRGETCGASGSCVTPE